jgi:U3 small nucleolar RNA-associated protein 16
MNSYKSAGTGRARRTGPYCLATFFLQTRIPETQDHIQVTIARMVITRGGAGTGSNQASSPATLKAQKKRRAEPEDSEPESPSPTKRKKVNQADNTRSESPIMSKKIAVRPHPDAEPSAASTENPKPALPVRNHIRFNSASPPPATEAPAIVQTPPVVENEAEEESDDDAAPETVSLSTAKARSRAVEEQTEQIAKELSESAKRKRRRRDAKLKAQAESSTKRIEKKKKTALKATEGGEDEDAEQLPEKRVKGGKKKHKEKKENSTKSSYSLDNIPDFLPAELLATEAPVRLPTPPPSSKPSQSKDMKIFEPFAALKIPKENAPKDLTYDNLSVRILGQKNPLLPPKVTSRSKSIRETWLKGRSTFENTASKRNTSGKLQRRPMGGATKAFV